MLAATILNPHFTRKQTSPGVAGRSAQGQNQTIAPHSTRVAVLEMSDLRSQRIVSKHGNVISHPEMIVLERIWLEIHPLGGEASNPVARGFEQHVCFLQGMARRQPGLAILELNYPRPELGRLQCLLEA